jgi:hypothetical protein
MWLRPRRRSRASDAAPELTVLSMESHKRASDKGHADSALCAAWAGRSLGDQLRGVATFQRAARLSGGELVRAWLPCLLTLDVPRRNPEIRIGPCRKVTASALPARACLQVPAIAPRQPDLPPGTATAPPVSLFNRHQDQPRPACHLRTIDAAEYRKPTSTTTVR